jgi:molybdate transport system substrate-binding protein
MYVPFFRRAVFSATLLVVVVLATRLSGCAKPRDKGAPPRALRVAAASDLETAFTELGRLYRERFAREVVFSFASSSVLAQQVEKGAPFDLYAAANAALVEKLEAKGHIVAGSRRLYARGRLVLYTKPGSGETPASIEALRDPRFGRIALANPEHAPYGQAAVQALRAASIYDAVKPRLIFSENVRQAHQFVETGNVDVAIGALSLLKPDAPHTAVPQALHEPLLQVLGAVQGGDEAAAEKLSSLILSPDGQSILSRHGFLPPS